MGNVEVKVREPYYWRYDKRLQNQESEIQVNCNTGKDISKLGNRCYRCRFGYLSETKVLLILAGRKDDSLRYG